MVWPWKKETRTDDVVADPRSEGVLLEALIGGTSISKDEALNIPSVRSCINFIADTVSMLPIKLYREGEGKAEEVDGDRRVRLINDDTGDTLDAVQFWRALIVDYYLGKGGYAYINRHSYKNEVISIHYIDESRVSTVSNTDPIFKSYKVMVNGVSYWPHEFIKLLRNTKNGATGIGIVEENSKLLSVAYSSLIYEENLVKKGGNKKGFLKSQKKLSEEAMNVLKSAWRSLYSNNSDNVVILNEGMEFQEASNTSVEMQLNENKETNSAEICKIFNVPENIIKGKASSQEYVNAFKLAIMPVLIAIECALNRELLLESEKGSFYFAFDTKETLKGDIKERFDAYRTAIEANFMQIDEVRFMEDLPALGLDWIKLGLDSVLYDVKTKTIYTPNTNETTTLK